MPRLLDLFCGAGGAAMGYHRAGFDVVGVDIKPQPRYPFTFIQADAMTYPLDGFDAIHASPPCQDHSALSSLHAKHGTGWMLASTRERLEQSGLPWVIENVPGAPMRVDFRLCGCMFGLPRLKRDRWFETSWNGFDLRAPCHHRGRVITVAGHGMDGRYYRDGVIPSHADRQTAMGIEWMTDAELVQAIPPAYTEYIGAQLLDHLARGRLRFRGYGSSVFPLVDVCTLGTRAVVLPVGKCNGAGGPGEDSPGTPGSGVWFVTPERQGHATPGRAVSPGP